MTSAALEQLDDHKFSEQDLEPETSLVERSIRSLKAGDAFAVLDANGDIGVVPGSPDGLFVRDTRYLSHLEFLVEGQRPYLLGSVIEDNNGSLCADLTNPGIHRDDGTVLPRDIIAIERTKFLYKDTCYERIVLTNYDVSARRLRVSVGFGSDFRDLFEVRGMKRKASGRSTARVVNDNTVVLSYEGLDEIARETRLIFEPAPVQIDKGRATFDLEIAPNKNETIFVTVACGERSSPRTVMSYAAAARASVDDHQEMTRGITTVDSTDALFHEVVCRATSDLYMLVSRTPHGLYPYAGIPWFSTVFGRDGIITALMTLWVDPNVAKGVLRHLAATQATDACPEADSQPGKILHEARAGEMAALKEVPFGAYYGTVDATPLFVMLAGAYYERTGDRATIETLWPHIEAALAWCDTHGDRDGDGFVEYYRETDTGLANQGWKDSFDSIYHADGSDAKGPIALCEVQGYVYAAKAAAAQLATVLGHTEKSNALSDQASALKARFHEAYWCEEIGTYALALDGEKRQCKIRSSNAGHALFTGIADDSVAPQVAAHLVSDTGFSGWGIRTIADGEVRFNPMSYHNGSVWPHDNGLIALGFDRFGFKEHAVKVFDGLFALTRYQELRRLPELFCGFRRRLDHGPTAYPVACAPQAWAAASVFALLSACLGLRIDHAAGTISLHDPRLPSSLNDLVIRSLRVGDGVADLSIRRAHGTDVTVSVIERRGHVRVVQIK